MKKLLLTFIIFSFVVMSASATDTRLETMGMGSFWYDGTFVPALNTVVKDDANISMYPSTINYYPNIFWGEIDGLNGGSSKSIEGRKDFFYKAGAIFQKNEDDDEPCTFGMHFSTVPYQGSFYHNLNNYNSSTQTNHRINLYYGRNLSGMPFGFTLGYFRSSAINEDVLNTSITNQFEDTYNRYELGFGLSPMEGKLEVALNVALTNWVDKRYHTFGDANADNGVVDETEPDGNFEFSVRGRYFMEPKGKFTCVPHLAFESKKYGQKVFQNGQFNSQTEFSWQVYRTDETKISYIDLGWGMNYDAAEDVLFVTDCGITFGSYKNSSSYTEQSTPASSTAETERTYKAMPYFKLGLDAKILKWLDFRAGVNSLWNQYKYERSYTDNSFSYGESFTTTQTFLGVGMHWGALEIDALLDPEFLLNGPYFIGGEPTDNNYNSSSMFGKVSFKYGF